MFKRMIQNESDLTQDTEVSIEAGEITELNLAEIHQVSGGCPVDNSHFPQPLELLLEVPDPTEPRAFVMPVLSRLAV